MKDAYLIANVEEYGKLIAYCIEHDVSVFRTYWNDREKGDRCYQINWQEKRCYYSSRQYYEDKGYNIVTPTFCLDDYGVYKIQSRKTVSAE